jgi:HEAT repeat protein
MEAIIPNWLQKLRGSKNPKVQKKKTTPTSGAGTGSTAVRKIRLRSEGNPIPVAEPETVLVRGRRWKNTAEDRWDIAPEKNVLSDANVEDMMEQLAQTERKEVRCSAAAKLSRMGPAAGRAISALIKSTVDVDATVREAALTALNGIDPAWPENAEARKSIPVLAEALKSWSPDVPKASIKLLNLIGPCAIPELTDALSNAEDAIDKAYLMQVLARIGPSAESAVPGLIRALSSPCLPVRISAAEALANIGLPVESAVPALVAGLSDPFADGRQAMAACLAHIGAAAEPAVPALLPLLADREDEVREAAAAALEQIGPKTVPALIELVQTLDVQRLKTWFESKMDVTQWHASSTVGAVAIDPQKILMNLSWTAYDIMKERSSLEAAQIAALRIMGKLGPAAQAAVPALSKAVADSNPDIRSAAVQALGQIGSTARNVIPGLVQLLGDSSESVRTASVMALGKIDPNWASGPAAADSAAILARQLGSEGIPGEIAVHSLTAIGTAAVAALVEVLESGDRIAQENAAKTLGQIGAGAKAAIPALTSATQKSHPWVQAEAAKALAKIDPRIASG